jgi:hypothetical protein
MKPLPALVLHVGLHKTGTTSVQYICNNNRHLLNKYNIIYPEDRELTLGTPLHLALTTDIFSAQLLISRCSNINCNFVFMSNEGFGFSLIEVDDLVFQNFIQRLYSTYSDVIWVVSLRNDRDLLTSSAREYLDGSAFPMQGIDQFLISHVEKIRKLANLLKGRSLKIIDIDGERDGKNWPSYFLSKVFDIEIEVPDSYQNLKKNKSINSLFSSIFRSFYHNIFSEHYYSVAVSEATERALTAINIDVAFESEFSNAMNNYIDDRVNNLMDNKNYRSIKKIFYED